MFIDLIASHRAPSIKPYCMAFIDLTGWQALVLAVGSLLTVVTTYLIRRYRAMTVEKIEEVERDNMAIDGSIKT